MRTVRLYETRQADASRTGRFVDVAAGADGSPLEDALRRVAREDVPDGMPGFGCVVGRLDGKLSTWRALPDDGTKLEAPAEKARKGRKR